MSLALPFHLTCVERMDWIQHRIHYFPLISGNMAAQEERLPSSKFEEDLALFDSVTKLGLDWVSVESRGISSRYVDSLDGAFRVVEDRVPNIPRN